MDDNTTSPSRVSEAGWNAMRWPDRIQLFKRLHALNDWHEVSKVLHVCHSTVKKWACGLRVPNPRHAETIRRTCVMRGGVNEAISVFASIHTSSVEGVLSVVDNPVAGGTVQARLILSSVVCVKIMHLLKDVMKLPLVLYMTTNYSSNPVKSCIRMETPADVSFEGLCVVEYNTDLNGKNNMLLKVQLRRSGRVDQSYAYVLNDKSVATVAGRIQRYLKQNYDIDNQHE